MAEFSVVYPDSNATYQLSATPATKSTLNSAGLAVEDASYKSTLANDNLVIESVGVGGVAHTLGWNADGFTMDSQLQMNGVVQGQDLSTKLSGINGLVVKNETDQRFTSHTSNGFSAFNSDSTRAGTLSYDQSSFSLGDEVSTLSRTALTVANTTRTATVNPNEIKLVDTNAGSEIFTGMAVGEVRVRFNNLETSLSNEEIKATTNASGGGVLAQFGRLLTDRVEMTDNTDPDDIKQSYLNPTSLNFFRDGNATNITMDATGLKLTTGSFQPTSLLDVSGNAGVDGQYLLSNGTSPVWTTVSAPPVPTLQEVVTAGNTISDATSIVINNSAGLEATHLVDRFQVVSTVVGSEAQSYLNEDTLYFSKGASSQNITNAGSRITTSELQPSELWDTATGSAGVAGQYLTTTGSGTEWKTLPAGDTPSLADVLAVATAGDAEDQPISNLSSMGFQPSSVGQTALAITAGASSIVGSTADVLAVNYAKDETSGRVFSNAYVEIKVAGVSYWVQLFSAPPAP